MTWIVLVSLFRPYSQLLKNSTNRQPCVHCVNSRGEAGVWRHPAAVAESPGQLRVIKCYIWEMTRTWPHSKSDCSPTVKRPWWRNRVSNRWNCAQQLQHDVCKFCVCSLPQHSITILCVCFLNKLLCIWNIYACSSVLLSKLVCEKQAIWPAGSRP